MRGLEIQFRTRSRILPTKQGRALTFAFQLGPIQVFIIANMPERDALEEAEGPLVYIKLNLKSNENWQVFREHSVESIQDKVSR